MTTSSTLSYVESYQEKSSLLRKNFFSFFAATMARSGFGPYHGLWRKYSPSKRIVVTGRHLTSTSGAGARLVWRGAETWGFHESPSYPHKYCFLVWMERKNGIYVMTM